MYVYDFSNVGMPQLIGSLEFYPHKGYNHAGWLNKAGDTYVFADETSNMDVKIADVTDLTDILIVDTVNTGGDTNSMAHNPIIKGALVYVSYYMDGLWIYDISDPGNTTVTGSYLSSLIGCCLGYGSNNITLSSSNMYDILPCTQFTNRITEGVF